MVAVARASRAANRAQRARVREKERAAKAAHRAQVQAHRQSERDARRAERESEALFHQSQESEADELTTEVEARVAQLQGVLSARPRASAVDIWAHRSPEEACRVAFEGMRQSFVPTPLNAEAVIGPVPQAPTPDAYRSRLPKGPGFFASLFGGVAKYETEVAEIKKKDAARFAEATATHRHMLAEWEARGTSERVKHEAAEQKRAEEMRAHNEGLADWQEAFEARDPDAVVQYLSYVLDCSDYGDDLDEEYEVAYDPERRVLTCTYTLPSLDVVPEVRSYAYVKSAREIREKARPKSERATLYRGLVASLALRTLRELFAAAPESCLEAVTFHGVVDGRDPATGAAASVCVISVNAERTALKRIEFERVDPIAALQAMGAAVSKKPEELAAVRRVDEGGARDTRFATSSRAVGKA